MTPTTRLPLVERLRHIVSEAKRLDDEEADGVNFAPCLDDDHYGTLEEAAALIEKQGAVIEALSQALKDIAFNGVSDINKDRFMASAVDYIDGGGKYPNERTVAAYALLAAKALGERE